MMSHYVKIRPKVLKITTFKVMSHRLTEVSVFSRGDIGRGVCITIARKDSLPVHKTSPHALSILVHALTTVTHSTLLF